MRKLIDKRSLNDNKRRIRRVAPKNKTKNTKTT